MAATTDAVTVLATLPVRPGQLEAAVAAFAPLLAMANGELGTEVYMLHTRGDELIVYERYTNAAAAAAHSASLKQVREGARVLDHAAQRPRSPAPGIASRRPPALVGLPQVMGANKQLTATLAGKPKIEVIKTVGGKRTGGPRPSCRAYNAPHRPLAMPRPRADRETKQCRPRRRPRTRPRLPSARACRKRPFS